MRTVENIAEKRFDREVCQRAIFSLAENMVRAVSMMERGDQHRALRAVPATDYLKLYAELYSVPDNQQFSLVWLKPQL
jgi:plasmid maintenance system killer protein